MKQVKLYNYREVWSMQNFVIFHIYDAVSLVPPTWDQSELNVSRGVKWVWRPCSKHMCNPQTTKYLLTDFLKNILWHIVYTVSIWLIFADNWVAALVKRSRGLRKTLQVVIAVGINVYEWLQSQAIKPPPVLCKWASSTILVHHISPYNPI